MLIGLGGIGLFGWRHSVGNRTRRHRMIDVGLLRRRRRRN